MFPTRTLVDLLRHRAQTHGRRCAYTFLKDGEEVVRRRSYGELVRAAHGIAARLLESLQPGDRALLLYPPGVEFAEAFLGALFAGVVSVPTFPPTSRRTVPRLQAIVADAGVRVVLGESSTLPRFLRLSRDLEALASLEWLATDTISTVEGEPLLPEVAPDKPAFLQYTSGSTAAPKGVVVTHGNLMHNESLIQRAFDQSANSVIAGWLPAQHDMGLIGNLLQPLYVGAHAVLMSPTAFLQRPRRWLEVIHRFSGTTSGGPNFAYDLCIAKIPPVEREGLDLRSWRVAFNGAEPVRATTLERFAEAFAACGFDRRAFVPCYGLAEATLFVSGTPAEQEPVVRHFSIEGLESHRVAAVPAAAGVEEGRALVGCGVAPEGMEVRIVDPETRRPSLPDTVGEIWLAGGSIAAGYWNRSGGGEEFQGFMAGGEGPYLRTGDLGFFHEGEWFIAGRLKDLIILRGRNHWPQDLELTAEGAHPALRSGSTAAFTVPDPGRDVGEEGLVLALETGRRPDAEPAAIAEAVRTAVAEGHGVEVARILLLGPGRVPKTSSGKVQRSRCRQAYLQGDLPLLFESGTGGAEATEDDGEKEAPRSEVEERLSGLWSGLFEGRTIHRNHSFFRLGGDSVAAAQLTARIHSTFGVDMGVEAVFEASTVEAQARRIEEVLREAAQAPEPASEPIVGGQPPRLSFAQERLWFLHRLEPSSPAYNLPLVLRFRGPMEVAALWEGLETVVRRHDTLRSRLTTLAGKPRVEIDPPESVMARRAAALPRVDLSALPPAKRPSVATELVRREGLRPFDLAAGPLLRSCLLGLGEGESYWLLDLHHSIADGWSMVLLLREVAAVYNARLQKSEAFLPALPVQYADFAAWERRRRESETARRDLEYWRQRLAGTAGALELPADGRRSPGGSFRGGRTQGQAAAGADLVNALRRVGERHEATLFMVLLAAFVLLLRRLSGETDLSIGVPVASRPRGPLEHLIGLFLNTVVLRMDTEGDSFEDLLAEVRRTTVEAYRRQETPFERIVEALGLPRDPGRNPLFQVFFNLLNFPRGEVAFGGLEASLLSAPEPASKFDLAVTVDSGDGELRVDFVYNADLFSSRRMDLLVQQYLSLLQQVAERPEEAVARYSLRTGVEAPLPDPAVPLPTRTGGSLGAVLVAAAERHPHRPAVVEQEGRRVWSHRELAHLSYRLGHFLPASRREAPERGRWWVFLAQRGSALVWALAGAVQAGAPFVLLDPALPPHQRAARLRRLQDHGGVAGLLELGAEAPPDVEAFLQESGRIVRRRWASLAAVAADGELARYPGSPPAVAVGAEDPAYVAFTSGSTGEPRAIVGPYGALSHFFEVYARTFKVGPEDRFSLLSGLGHDPLLRDVFAPLTLGAAVCVPPTDDGGLFAAPQRLRAWLAQVGVTVAHLTPPMIHVLTSGATAGELGALRHVFSGGDQLMEREVAAVVRVAPGAVCINLYGATETPQGQAYHVAVPPSEIGQPPRPVSLGRGIDGVELQVVNAAGESAGVGELGEILVRGPYLALGYLGEEELTSQRFRGGEDPAYRTGDLGRYDPDGSVTFAGRKDAQVKIRGFRVEPRAVERELESLPGVERAAVVPRLGAGGERELVAFLEARVSSSNPLPEVGALLRHLRARVAPSHLPAAFFTLEGGLPLNANGKVNRRALAFSSADGAGVAQALTSGSDYVAPRDSLEADLCALWGEVLDRERVGTEDNFFESGGNSLSAVRLAAEVERRLETSVPVVALFERPTVRALAEMLRRPERGIAPSAAAALAQSEDRGSKRRQLAARRRRRAGV